MTSPGVARTFFSFYVIIITSTLRFRLRYAAVAGVRFLFTLRYRSGREAHRGSRLRTWPSLPSAVLLVHVPVGSSFRPLQWMSNGRERGQHQVAFLIDEIHLRTESDVTEVAASVVCVHASEP